MRTTCLLAALLFAGCLEIDAGARTLQAGPQHRFASDPRLPGLVVEGDLETTGEGFVAQAEARNEGSRTFQVSSICDPVWHESVFDPDGKEIWRNPQAVCLAYGREDFPPGDTRSGTFSWNGEALEPETGEEIPAAPGDYVWEIRFVATDENEGHSVKLRFDVQIAESG